MAEAEGKLGIARAFALTFGVAYIAVAMVEVILGGDGLVVGDEPIASINQVVLLFEPVHNIVHWVAGVVLLGSFSGGAPAAKVMARVAGIVFLIVTVLGLVAGEAFMEFLGYEGATSVPISYTLLHAVTAAGGLFAGFAGGSGRPATT